MQTKIKEYRAKQNLTQDQLANLVNVRRETIVFLEQGKYNPSLKLASKHLLIIYLFFEVATYYLLFTTYYLLLTIY
jgi:DNA-binding XRE family transcriptional regulator